MSLMERIVSATLYRNIKYVTTIHGLVDKRNHISLKDRIEKNLNKIFAIPLAARFYISNGVRIALEPLFSPVAFSEVCYNPLNFDVTFQREYRLHSCIGVSTDTIIIGTICRISYVKNPQSFTQVMCNILREMPLVHAVVMGDGDEDIKRDCRLIVKKAEVENRFHWLGYRQDAPQLVQDLDCFIMTSRSEGLPTALLESMVMKTPIAMMEGEGGLRDLSEINRKEGPIAIVSCIENIDGMASDIIELLKSPQKAKEQADRAYSVGKKYFDVSVVVKQLCNIYKRIL